MTTSSWVIHFPPQTTPAIQSPWMSFESNFPLEHIRQIHLTGVFVKGMADSTDALKVNNFIIEMRSPSGLDFSACRHSSNGSAIENTGIFISAPDSGSFAAPVGVFMQFTVPMPVLRTAYHGSTINIEARLNSIDGTTAIKHKGLVLHMRVESAPKGERPLDLSSSRTPFGRQGIGMA